MYNILGVFILELEYPCLIIFSVFYYGFPCCQLSFVFPCLLFLGVNSWDLIHQKQTKNTQMT